MSGAIVYGAVILIVNMKMLESFNSFTGWGEVLIFLSTLSYFFVFWAENKWESVPVLYGIFMPVMTDPTTYFALFLCGASVYTIDVLILQTKIYLKK